MLSRPCRPFVCRRCLTRAAGTSTVLINGPSERSSPIQHGVRSRGSYWHNASWKRTATHHASPKSLPFGQSNISQRENEPLHPLPKDAQLPSGQDLPGGRDLPIRERLRQWEELNEGIDLPELPQDLPLHGGPTNTLSRTQSTGSSSMLQLRNGSIVDDDSSGQLDESDPEGVFAGLGPRSPGDLVELRQLGSRVPLLGIYLGFYCGRHNYYSANGKWVTSMGLSFPFSVPNFATAEELEPVLAKVPTGVSPDEMIDMQYKGLGPMRDDARDLIDKLTGFRERAESIYQANISMLEGARKSLPHDEKIVHLSLAEIADRLLPSTLKGTDGFPPEALYAVQMALMRVEVGFRPINPTGDCSRLENLFEILPHDCLTVLERVASLVREFTDIAGKRSLPLGHPALNSTTLGGFFLQARTAVVASRQQRDWTRHGILKTSLGIKLPETQWTPVSQDVISFLAWWSSFDMFHSNSRFHAYGAIIMRGLALYKETDLNQSTAWTFLQEIGRITPWEIPSRYKTRLPGVSFVKGGGLSRELPDELDMSKRPDIAADARKQVSNHPVLCIDAPSTMVIDDGVSLERTENPDVFWVHVHVADPASVIKPRSELCKYLELIPENIYLPGHFQAMLPSELGEDDAGDYKAEGLIKQFSLHSGGPALTFSTKMNSAGEVLEYEVQPSVLGNVVYLSPGDVSKFCNEPEPPVLTGKTLSVGTPPPQSSSAPERPMAAIKDLDAPIQDDIQTLYKLAQALRQARLAKGAWPYFALQPSISVALNPGSEDGEAPSTTTKVIPADPWINVTTDASAVCSVVSEFMLLTGRIAARWCSSRGIPVPYRRDSKSVDNTEAALAYASNAIHPLIQKGVDPPMELRQELTKLTGRAMISSQPGPYFILGLEEYAKATSPLRRFGDLLLHWQIHAALAAEREKNRRLDPSVDNLDEILPFSAAALEAMLPLLQMREKMGRSMSRAAVDWILIALVRAWRFEGKAPHPLKFKVASRLPSALTGSIDLFQLSAVIDVDGLEDCRLMKDVRIGDIFDVELVDINVHSRMIRLKALRYLGQGETGPEPSTPKSGETEAPSA